MNNGFKGCVLDARLNGNSLPIRDEPGMNEGNADIAVRLCFWVSFSKWLIF